MRDGQGQKPTQNTMPPSGPGPEGESPSSFNADAPPSAGPTATGDPPTQGAVQGSIPSASEPTPDPGSAAGAATIGATLPFPERATEETDPEAGSARPLTEP